MAPDTKKTLLEFEKALVPLEERVAALRASGDASARAELAAAEAELEKRRAEVFQGLTPWDRVLLARHPDRPYTLDYVQRLIEQPLELHGDRSFRDDQAIVGGVGWFRGRRVVWMGQEKGRKTADKIRHNFGSAHPEGYRKAMRLMGMAEKFRLPVISFIDTGGAYPGVGAEERGQAEAIARNVVVMFGLTVPFVAVVIGEGGSGGAFGIGVGNVVAMQENAYYSVISPEGCAAILWRDRAYAPQSSAALKITSDALLELGIIDDVIPEPPGGAHRDYDRAAALVGDALERYLKQLETLPPAELREHRRRKFLAMGFYEEKAAADG